MTDVGERSTVRDGSIDMLKWTILKMNELEYIDYVKSVSDVRLLLNPSLVDPLVTDWDVLETIYDLDLEYPSDLILNDLRDSPVVIDIDHDGRIVFLYAVTDDLLDQILLEHPDLSVVATTDPDYDYVRIVDFDRLLDLRQDYTRI